MLDIGWSELLLIAVVALVVLGPKDLPRAMRFCAHWVRKARGMMREFQGHVDEMMREAELDEVRKEMEKASALGPEIERTVDPGGTIKAALDLNEPAPPSAAPALETPAPASSAPHEETTGTPHTETAGAPPSEITSAPPAPAETPAPDVEQSGTRRANA